jgi:hypothetical protein
MLGKVVQGEGFDAYLMGSPNGSAPSGVIVGTTPLVSSQDETGPWDGLSLHLIVDYQVDQIPVVAGSDNVVASTGVWTFGGYTFTGKTGAGLIVIGAANAGNNVGTLPRTGLNISAVGAHTATTATTGLVNETFGAGVSAFVVRSEATSKPAGAWTIQGSNDFFTAGAPQGGVPAQLGHWPDITPFFNSPTTIAAVTDATSQIVQPPSPFSIRSVRATFTPSTGLGVARVARFAKSWS